ncbi:unnamed protein product [Spirodela intermedia]|uniref:Morc S5 domain-containing protein n=1 Tax=Spirodela intermedia TaxID=51605 RepID=A0A7I8JFP9_SPIIN|nr:unnamed protein product [Spirodela intermedia]CAA6668343.1 unnamed protein product [Spirodela intermedia]
MEEDGAEEGVTRGSVLGRRPPEIPGLISLIGLSSSGESDDSDDSVDSDDSDDSDEEEGIRKSSRSEDKRRRVEQSADPEMPLKKRKSASGAVVALPAGFLDPLPLEEKPLRALPLPPAKSAAAGPLIPAMRICKQFWKAGDYEGHAVGESSSRSVGMDHVRVHPKFLHSNATSHKWALGAIAELLDNSLDEICNGATFVNIDVLDNKKDKTKMLLVEDNGGGMDLDKMRQCMSLGYSVKSKSANTIGQYGNGFKTSTMRLGADVIVFSRCRGEGKSSTQSIGMLSYTFLRTTGQEDIVLDYVGGGMKWKKAARSSEADWNRNLETILQWSPYSSEDDLLYQFDSMADHGTRVVIFNLWEDDQGQLELDFGAEKDDIQIRGVNRDEKKIEMAKKFPNSWHFLTYRHSLRSYASILYLRLPEGFRMILRGKEIIHHSIIDDMMFKQEVTYKPHNTSDGVPRDPNMVAEVTVGFVKDAKDHVDVQGFNVYHKNRLIKPFWRVWNASGSGGRGVIGVLEANFVEPAHDKQDFERTIVLARLEARLVQMQKAYWGKSSHLVGYDPNKKSRPRVAEELPSPSSGHSKKERSSLSLMESNREEDGRCFNGDSTPRRETRATKDCAWWAIRGMTNPKTPPVPAPLRLLVQEGSPAKSPSSQNQRSSKKFLPYQCDFRATKSCRHISRCSNQEQLRSEILRLQDSLRKSEDRGKALAARLGEVERKLEQATEEQEALIDLFSEERIRREREEEKLRKMLKDASTTINELLEKLSKDRR